MLKNLLKTFDEGLERLVFGGRGAAGIRLGALALAAAVAWGSWTPAQIAPASTPSSTPAADLLMNRPWFDGYPVDPKPEKPYHAYLFADDGMGLYVTLKSRYTQEIELFYYKADKGKIQIYLPETKVKANGSYAISPCKGPGEFDVKLALSTDPKNSLKAKDYYSFEHWGAAREVGLSLPDVSELRAPPAPEGLFED